MNNTQLIKQIYSNNKYDLMGYKHVEPENLRTNTYIKYYNPETNKVSKRVSIKRIHYFSEITKDKPMKLEVYDGFEHSWNIICKHHIIFRQFEQVSSNDKNLSRYLDEQINIYNQNDEN